MSADNGIYIAKFPDGYRVCYGMAIENIDYYPEGSKERKKELKEHFGKSKLFKKEEDAWIEAHKMEKKWNDYLEYGVCNIGEYESFEKPTKQK